MSPKKSLHQPKDIYEKFDNKKNLINKGFLAKYISAKLELFYINVIILLGDSMKKRINKRLKQLKIVNVDSKTPIPRGYSYYCTETQKLNKMIENHNLPLKRQMVANILLMYINDCDISEIMEATKLNKSSIYNYINKYKSSKSFIYSVGKKPKQTISALEPYKHKIALDFETTPIKSYAEAQKRIFVITGIQITIPRIYTFLNKNNFKKINERYIQEITPNNMKDRIVSEKQFLNENIFEIKNFITNNHLTMKRGLSTIIRKQFGTKYVNEYYLREYIRKNKLSGYY